MSDNIASLIKNKLGKNFLVQTAVLLDETENQTKTALNKAVPLILNAVVDSSNTGENQPAALYENTENNLVENFTAQMHEKNYAILIDKGATLLNAIIGNEKLSKISNTVANSSNIKSQSASSLIALITPLIVGIIQLQTENQEELSTNHLVNEPQKQTSNPAQQQRNTKMDKSENSVQQPSKTETHNKPHYGKLLWIPLFVIIGLSAYFFLPTLLPQDTELDVAAIVDKIGTKPSSSEYINISNDLSNIINNVTDNLLSISDAESASAALPKITAASSKLGRLTKQFNQLPDSAKSTIANIAESRITTLQPVIDRVSKIPAAAPIVMPVLNAIKEKLTAFSVV